MVQAALEAEMTEPIGIVTETEFEGGQPVG
jgi:hypothetical protein